MSANQLKESLGMRPNNLHYHLDELCDVGLVQNRKQKTPDSDGLYSYYVASGMGKAILEHGVEELMRREGNSKSDIVVRFSYCDLSFWLNWFCRSVSWMPPHSASSACFLGAKKATLFEITKSC
jgi:hypothetical protein